MVTLLSSKDSNYLKILLFGVSKTRKTYRWDAFFSRGRLLCRRTDLDETPYKRRRYGVGRRSKHRCFKLVAVKHQRGAGKRVDWRRQFKRVLSGATINGKTIYY